MDGNLKELSKFRSINHHIIFANPKKLSKIDFIDDIAHNNNLINVCLKRCLIGDSGFIKLCKSKSIKELYVADTGIDDDGIKVFPSNSNLQTLHISDNKITSIGIESLVGNQSITYLDISYNPIDPTDVLNKLKQNGRQIISAGIPCQSTENFPRPK